MVTEAALIRGVVGVKNCLTSLSPHGLAIEGLIRQTAFLLGAAAWL